MSPTLTSFPSQVLVCQILSEHRTIPLPLLVSHGETACRWASLSPDRLVGERVPNLPYVHSRMYSLADFKSSLASHSVLRTQCIRTWRPIHMVWESWICLAISVASAWVKPCPLNRCPEYTMHSTGLKMTTSEISWISAPSISLMTVSFQA